ALETAAAAGLSNLDQRTASLRTSGALTAVAVVGADGHSSRILIGAAPPPIGPAIGPTLQAARDVGQARLSGLAGPEALIAVAPIYRGAPRGTAERRSLLDGYVVASVDLAELLGKSVTRPAGTTARLTDDAGADGPQGPPAGPGPVATRSVEGGGNTYVLTVTGAPAPSRFPVLPIGAGVLAALVLGAAARTV